MLIQNVTNSIPAAPGVNDGGAPVSPVSTGSADTAAVAAQPAPPSAAQLKSAVDSINKAMLDMNSSLEFSIDHDTRQTVIKVVDSKTGDTIKQFPSQEAIAIAKAIDQIRQGLLLKQNA